MKKVKYVCDICGKELDIADVFDVIVPRTIYYENDVLPSQTTIYQEEICWDCCKKIAKFIDTI